ncbi:predicted protein [Naegleria gruberi]|uniref:Predicted protein n=1 Tax=Naegleria gruberi TaxID=5762 RepID=D2VZG9_NAEGR|nr:uncharacterized protein NAEGRDRAFT_81824 [Naegleria gruberi]EFC37845.1 predicted protein [Naegleria gruberi]|eukprot:XP_002670589.1 predicted protein [Naegleria gruberi strain NEG-M]
MTSASTLTPSAASADEPPSPSSLTIIDSSIVVNGDDHERIGNKTNGNVQHCTSSTMDQKGHCSRCGASRKRSNTRPIMQNVTTVATRQSSRSAPPSYPISSRDFINYLRQNKEIAKNVTVRLVRPIEPVSIAEEEEAVTLTLDASIINPFYNALKEKMRGTVLKPFSLEFSIENSIGKTRASGKTNDMFYCPCDIAISYNSSTILVLDMGNNRIQVFTTGWRYRTTINLPAKHLCIEPNFDGKKNDALIISCNDHCIYKYDLEKLIACSKNGQKCDFIWRAGTPNSKGKSPNQFNLPSGMVCSNGNKENNFERILYVCDCNNNRVQILRTSNGNLLESIGETPEVDSIFFKGPWSIDLNARGEVIVCEVDGHRLQTLVKNDSGNWTSIQTFGIISGYSSSFNHPRSIVIDKVRNNIIVCDQDNNRIVSLNNTTGDVVQIFGSAGRRMDQFFKPFSLCLNEFSGELYVADFCNHRVQIFK